MRAPKATASGGGGPALYFEIANFQNGIDTRKNLLTAPAGTLRMLQNAHITPGGEAEKRSKFDYWCDVPSDTLGIVAVNNDVYAFVSRGGGGVVTPPTPSSAGLINLTPPGVGLLLLWDWDIYNGKIFAVFLGSDTRYYGYYDGINVPDATGRCYSCRTYKEKMYGVFGRNLYFSAIGDPTTWVDPPPVGGVVAHNGSGFISIGSNDSDSEILQELEVYYDKMAIFSKLGCQLWFLDPDPSLNQYYQTLRDAGALAPRSVRQYVANDVYFLGTHGIRSLRARDLTTTAAVADVGSPIDPIIQDLIATTDMSVMQTILSPRTGRIWMVLPDKIFVLSNFAAPNISAWSEYIPEFTIAPHCSVVFADPYLVLMSSDFKLYRFGSTGSLTYDSCPVSLITPALSFDKAASFKFYQGFDAICSALPNSMWNIQMSFDPFQATPPWDQICAIDGPTMLGGRIPVSGRGTHVQLKATHAAPGPATFSKMFIHYATSETG
jgi:hypothetical protein